MPVGSDAFIMDVSAPPPRAPQAARASDAPEGPSFEDHLDDAIPERETRPSEEPAAARDALAQERDEAANAVTAPVAAPPSEKPQQPPAQPALIQILASVAAASPEANATQSETSAPAAAPPCATPEAPQQIIAPANAGGKSATKETHHSRGKSGATGSAQTAPPQAAAIATANDAVQATGENKPASSLPSATATAIQAKASTTDAAPIALDATPQANTETPQAAPQLASAAPNANAAQTPAAPAAAPASGEAPKSADAAKSAPLSAPSEIAPEQADGAAPARLGAKRAQPNMAPPAQPTGPKDSFAALLAQNAETPAPAPAPSAVSSAAALSQSAADAVSSHAATHAPPAATQIAREIIRRHTGDSTRFELRLDPPELGRVEVRLEMSRDQRVTAIVAADNPQALAELTRHARELEQTLQSAGLELSEQGLSFDLSQSRQGSADAGADGKPRGQSAATPESADAPLRAAPLGLERWRGQRVDLVA